MSHPSRVRGLKLLLPARCAALMHRVAPFTGAWIEIPDYRQIPRKQQGVAPFTGAWIEIFSDLCNDSRSLGRTLHGCVD